MSRSLGFDVPQYSLLGTSESDEEGGSRSSPSSEAEDLSRPEDLDIVSLNTKAASGILWNRHKVLQEKALQGDLLDVLERFDMPLHSYRGLAGIYFEKAKKRFNDVDIDDQAESDPQISWLTRPTRFARLLSNFLLVPDMPLQNWMYDAEMEMVVFDHMRYDSVGRNTRTHTRVIPHEMPPVPYGFQRFPEHMGAFYINLIVDWHLMLYDQDKRTLEVQLPDGKLYCLEATRAFDIEDPLSNEMGMFPAKSKKFAFVYPHAVLNAGGFVYFEGEGHKPLALNQLSIVVRNHGFCMHDQPQHMNEEVSELLQREAKETTLEAMTSKGAKKFCFVGPGQPGCESFTDSSLGGFAYFFPGNEKNNCFFPIAFYCQLVERGPQDQLRAARLFEPEATSKSIKDGIVRSFFLSEERVGQTVDMKITRLRQPGITHPVVLFSLLNTPNEKLLQGPHFQAIVSAAFKTYEHHLYLELAFRIISLMSLSWFAFSYRWRLSGSLGVLEWQWCDWICFGAIFASWFVTTVRLILGLRGYSLTFGLGTGYFLGGMRLPTWWVQEIIVLLAMWFLLRGSDVSSTRRLAEAMLSAAGAMCWVQLLFVLRVFIFFGERFLPITSAWSKAGPFLLVNFFVLGACGQASFSLTHLPVEAIILDTYRMGFLGEMKPRLFVRPPEDLDENPEAMSGEELSDRVRSSWAYLFLFVFGFVLMVSMANIFIQVMGDAYQQSKERVEVILTQARAEESLISVLWLGGADDIMKRLGMGCLSHEGQQRQYVWYTTKGQCNTGINEVEEEGLDGATAALVAKAAAAAVEQHKKSSVTLAAAAASAAAAVAAMEDPRGIRNERRVRLAVSAGLAASDAVAESTTDDPKEVAGAAAKAALRAAEMAAKNVLESMRAQSTGSRM